MTCRGDEDRCDARLDDQSCCAGQCVREDQHEGKHICACGTEWGSLDLFEDDIFGGFRDRVPASD